MHTIRAIFRFLNPWKLFRAMPRITITLLLSIALFVAHYFWSIHAIARQQLAVQKLNAAGLSLPPFENKVLAPELNSAKYYNQIENLNDAYEAANSSSPSPDSPTGRQIIDLLRQSQNLDHMFTSDYPYAPVRLMQICSTLALSAGDPQSAETCLNASRKIFKHSWVLSASSRNIAECLANLQILATSLKPNDPLKPAFAALILDLEDKTPFKQYGILQIVGDLHVQNQSDHFSLLAPLKEIRFVLETDSILPIAKPLVQNDNIPSISIPLFFDPVFPKAVYSITSYLNERHIAGHQSDNVRDYFINIPRIRLTQAALAFQLYRIDHGEFPKTAKELVPAYLPQSFSDDRYKLVLLPTLDGPPRPFIAETDIGDSAIFTQKLIFDDRTFADLTLPPATNPVNLIPKPSQMK